MITTGSRPEYLAQSIRSLVENSADWSQHTLTLVMDGSNEGCSFNGLKNFTYIDSTDPMGASRARNIGAGSIPKYHRQSHVMFLDDDVYMVKGWDEAIRTTFGLAGKSSIVSAYGHPFNREEEAYSPLIKKPLVISSVCMAMSWEVFDVIGPWDEPGGSGASEDYALCMRAKERTSGICSGHICEFAVTNPHYCLHTGLTSSAGRRIVGYEEEAAQNDALLDLHGIRGKVIFTQ